jgi:hypothetical protein
LFTGNSFNKCRWNCVEKVLGNRRLTSPQLAASLNSNRKNTSLIINSEEQTPGCWSSRQLRYSKPFLMYSEHRYEHVLTSPIKMVDYQTVNKKIWFHYYWNRAQVLNIKIQSVIEIGGPFYTSVLWCKNSSKMHSA